MIGAETDHRFEGSLLAQTLQIGAGEAFALEGEIFEVDVLEGHPRGEQLEDLEALLDVR